MAKKDTCYNMTIDYFELPKASLSKRGLVHNHSYENEFNLHVNEISFSYERMSTKTRFEKEAEGNSEMAYCAFESLVPGVLFR